jgi:hypothetical protein
MWIIGVDLGKAKARKHLHREDLLNRVFEAKEGNGRAAVDIHHPYPAIAVMGEQARISSGGKSGARAPMYRERK